MVAGTVRELGVNLGLRLGANHEDPQFLKKDLGHIRDMIADRNNTYDTWGWKMPHSLEYIDQIEADLRNPHIVIVWRNTLATAMSQVSRSNASIHHALRFSADRMNEMVEQTAALNSPILLIDYDKAIAKKEAFLDELSSFLGIDPTEEMRENCLRFIDPQKGYQQVSDTYYEVTRVTEKNHPTQLDVLHVLIGIEPVPGQPFLNVTRPHPRFIFRTGKEKPLPKEFVVRFENRTDKVSKVQLLFDFDWQFSQNLSFKTEVEPGVHAFKISTNGKMQRLGVVPSITNDTSDLVLVDVREA